MFVIDQFLTLILGRESRFRSLSVLPSPARESISHADIKYGVIAIGNDVDPKIVITSHRSEFEIRAVSTLLDMTNEN